MASENRWDEYNAGTLTPPCVVQCDSDSSGLFFIWVYTQTGVFGPVTRKTYNESEVVAEIVAYLADAEEAANAEEVVG